MRPLLFVAVLGSAAPAAGAGEKKAPACLDTIQTARGDADAGPGLFVESTRVDATRLPAGERKRVGKLTKEGAALAPREVLRRAAVGGTIETSWHIGATLCVEREDKTSLEVSGVHEYYTSKRNEGHFRFRMEIDKDGVVSLVGE